MPNNRAVLSICTTCRDNRENEYDNIRGGTRLAQAITTHLRGHKDLLFDLRGVACMSQCKRPCVAAICSHNRFSYLFGDLDPEKPDNVEALLELVSLYVIAPEGFLRRRERPESLRSSILSRIPPTLSSSSLISPLVIENTP